MTITASKALVLFCAMVLVAGCAAPPPPAPDPTIVNLQIRSAADINPNPDGRPSPVILRIYQLKTLTAFEDADFFSLFERDLEVLGQDLLRKDEVSLKPGDTQAITLEPKDEVRFIGVMASFRDIDQAQWKTIASISPNQTNVLYLDVIGTRAAFK